MGKDQRTTSQMIRQAKEKPPMQRFWQIAIHGKMIYLIFFTMGGFGTLFISLFLSGNSYINLKIAQACILATAVLLKSISVCQVLSVKQLLKTQEQFAIPYLFTVMNIFFLAEVCIELNQAQHNTYLYNIQIVILESFRFFFMTFICSLITNKKTSSKLQFWVFTAVLILVVCCDVWITVVKIKNYSSLIDDMTDQTTNLQIRYLQPGSTMTQEQYQAQYQNLGVLQSGLENASALDLAAIASIVANYLVMLDMIGRPMQKKKQAKHLIHQIKSSKHSGINDSLIQHSNISHDSHNHTTQNDNSARITLRNKQSKQLQFKERHSKI